MKKLVLCALIGVVSAVAFAGNYFVDANNGNDDWDGTTATIPTQEVIDNCTAQGEPIPGPRKTLHAMMSDDRVVPGSVVNAAEGDYNEGGDGEGSNVTSNRVQVKAGVTLLATGSRDATFITGSGGLYTTGAVRCVYFAAPPKNATYGYGIVKRFTLRDGRTATTSEHGGASYGSGLLVECVLTGNGCANATRAGGMNGGTALRCTIGAAANGYALFGQAKAIDSLFSTAGASYSGCIAYNCTFTGNSFLRGSSSYNCFYIGTGAGDKNQNAANHYNTFSRSAFHSTACTTNVTCRVIL